MWTAVNSQPITFDTAEALGRIWQLSGQSAGLAVTVTTFIDDSTPAVFQRVSITNNGAPTRIIALDVTLSMQFEKGYVGSSNASRGYVGTHMQFDSSFGATLRPWQLVMDKMHNVLSYALPVAPDQSQEFCLITAAVDDAALDDLLKHWPESYAYAEAYNQKLMTIAAQSDPLRQSLIVAGLNVGLSSYKKLDNGVGGFMAGASYAFPPRNYFRDSYWTAQSALIVQPDMVRDNLLWLALGIGEDGSCPSGVWNPGLFTAEGLKVPGALNWLADHYDSPSFFVILLRDYIFVSQDRQLLEVQVHSKSLMQHAIACIGYLTEHDQDGDGLFEKPRAANDWADNVMRDSLVTYDLALFYRALVSLGWLAEQQGDLPLIKRCEAQASRVKNSINAQLWDETSGHYRDYQRAGFAENHLSIDSLLTVLYGIADEDKAVRSLDAAKRLLQTRHNTDQVYGDWGVMCCYPFYHEPADLFSISAEPYRYHNGADWPYWDGVYGLILKQRGDPDWQYVLTRWWEVALEHGWLTPLEYWSPPFPHGSLLQGWSAMPAVALLSERYGDWLR
jgi:glycogen debranching enzyme